MRWWFAAIGRADLRVRQSEHSCVHSGLGRIWRINSAAARSGFPPPNGPAVAPTWRERRRLRGVCNGRSAGERGPGDAGRRRRSGRPKPRTSGSGSHQSRSPQSAAGALAHSRRPDTGHGGGRTPGRYPDFCAAAELLLSAVSRPTRHRASGCNMHWRSWMFLARSRWPMVRGALIAVIDAGIDQTHPDLRARLPACSRTGRPWHGDPHGTEIAGIICAHGVVRGVAADARLLDVQRVSAPAFGSSGGRHDV